MNFRIDFYVSEEIVIKILTEITLTIYIALGSIDILTAFKP